MWRCLTPRRRSAPSRASYRGSRRCLPFPPTLRIVEGAATGLRSTRARRLLLLPTGGTPPLLPDWSAWEEVTAGDDTRRHWDAWPRPEHGTLEVRILDQQTDVRRSAGFAAIVQSLVRPCSTTRSSRRPRALHASPCGGGPFGARSPEVAALAALARTQRARARTSSSAARRRNASSSLAPNRRSATWR